jgi:hypothetical protein
VKTKVMDLAALPVLTPMLVTVDGVDVFLYRRPGAAAGADEILAIGNECPRVPVYRATVEDGAVYLEPVD